LWRPLLHESLAAIDVYVAALGLTPLVDPTNDSLDLRRNAVRHDVLPRLEAIVPGATAALARYAALAAEDDAALEAIAARAVAEGVDPGGRLTAAALTSQSLAVRRRMVRRWLAEVTGSTACSAHRIDAVVALGGGMAGGKVVEIGEGWTVRRERGMLHAARTDLPNEGSTD
jgi:tRNA(Ile)-lysidine synthase